MVEQRVVVRLPMGLHARPATALAVLASRFAADIQLIGNGLVANAKSALEVIGLAALEGTELLIRAEGEDAPSAVEQIAAFLEGGWEESGM